MGKEAVRKGLVEGTGAKVVAADWESGEGGKPTGLANSVMVRFCRCSFLFVNLDFFNLQDALCFNVLQFFAGKVSLDAAWAQEYWGYQIRSRKLNAVDPHLSLVSLVNLSARIPMAA